MTSIGNRISTIYEQISDDLVAAAKQLPVAIVGDVSNRLYCFPAGYQNYSKVAKTFAGPAFTVRVRPGDNLFLHKALDLAKPGDVIVCDAAAALDNAVLGELMGRYAASRGVAAIVINGAVRDTAGLAKLPIPVYARGVTPNGPFKSGPGEIGYPVAVGGVAISSGDLLIGDEDGLIALPRSEAPAVLEHAQAHVAVEARWLEQITAGTWPRGWVDQSIAELK